MLTLRNISILDTALDLMEKDFIQLVMRLEEMYYVSVYADQIKLLVIVNNNGMKINVDLNVKN